MFWGLVLEPHKKYTQKVDQTFHISQAALDLKSCDLNPVQLVVEYGNSNFVLATLSKIAKIFQVPLDLIFKTGDQVSFLAIGNGKVHLSGYHVLEDLDSMMMNGEDESDMEEMEDVLIAKHKKKKSTPNTKVNKKAKLEEINEEESNDDDEDEDDEEDIVSGKAGKRKGKRSMSLASKDGDDDEDDDDEDDEDDGEDDDDDDEEEEDGEEADEGEDDEDEADIDMEDEDDTDAELEEEDEFYNMDLDDSEDENLKTPKSEKKKTPQTTKGNLSNSKEKDKSNEKLNSSKKDKGKGEKPMKNGEGETTPHKKGSLENLKNNEKTPKSPKVESSPQKKVLQGGVISEEIEIGNGPIAKPGKMVTVYYVGTLASNKKQFDSVQNGPGFKFRVGKNEVIKGWDIGINGMKVGGKRKLTIPPHLAYGSKGSPPVIPPNSTLVFTVELKGLS